MEAKEKAKQLINKFLHIKVLKLSDYSVIEYPTAKECALITVNDILDNIEAIMLVYKEKTKEIFNKMYQVDNIMGDYPIAVDEMIEEVKEYCDHNFHQERLLYWQQVKQELDNL